MLRSKRFRVWSWPGELMILRWKQFVQRETESGSGLPFDGDGMSVDTCSHKLDSSGEDACTQVAVLGSEIRELRFDDLVNKLVNVEAHSLLRRTT